MILAVIGRILGRFRKQDVVEHLLSRMSSDTESMFMLRTRLGPGGEYLPKDISTLGIWTGSSESKGEDSEYEGSRTGAVGA